MSKPIRVCLISVEIFAWGKYGGFGKATRIIGRELVKRGYDVYAVVPRRLDQKEEEILDGIRVISFLPSQIFNSGDIYKKINADIYHSCEPSLGTWLAMKNVPHAKHIVTSRDPRDSSDWWQEFLYPSKSKAQVVANYFYEHNPLIRGAVRKADAVFVPAQFLKEKVNRIYKYQKQVEFLPTPTEIPKDVVKSEKPVVLAMGRIDPRKKLETILDLAVKRPDITFKIAGKARNPEYEKHLKDVYGKYPNIHFIGFLDQFSGDTHHQTLSEAWILINASAREGLPNAFIEAIGHQCAILSHLNPDDFASRFGYHVLNNEFDQGLQFLLQDDLWKRRGMEGYEYAWNTFDVEAAMNAHEEAYRKVMNVAL